MRLDRFLGDMGAGTRSELKKMIRKGRVRVNGEVVRDPSTTVSGQDEVTLDGRAVRYEEFSYLMLNKPQGVVSATQDGRLPTVIDLLPQEGLRKDLFPVGRLDRDTEGLLLITNDGDLAHRLLSPSRHVDKVYLARVRGEIGERQVQAFAQGLVVDEEFTAAPAGLEVVSSGPVSEVRVTIHEGKFHQIKRMFLAVGSEVLYLRRLSMGPLLLDESLAPGQSRPLTGEEIEALKSCT